MRISTLALVAAFGLAGGTANAADYEPPLAVAEAPEYVPVEIGSGWYLRGDIGYNLNEPLRDDAYGVGLLSHSDEENPFSGSVGFGYHFTDYFRTDVNLGYLWGNEINDTYAAGNVHVQNSALYAMANAYVDLGTYVGITPYVGAGIGIYRAKRRLDGTDTGVAFYDHSNQYSLAYSLNAGLAYQVTPSLAIDLGYQYFAAPNAEYQTTQGLTVNPIKEGLSFHQIRLGLRYDLW